MEIKEAVRRFIVANFFVPEGSPLADSDPLLEHGVVDSTGVLEIIRFIEENYAIKLDDDEIVPENLGSIARIAEFIERKGGALQAPSAPAQSSRA
jgi:acyl carrier protein